MKWSTKAPPQSLQNGPGIPIFILKKSDLFYDSFMTLRVGESGKLHSLQRAGRAHLYGEPVPMGAAMGAGGL